VIIHDLNVFSTRVRPAKANTIPIVHADAVLPDAVAFKRLQPVSWRHSKVFQTSRDLQLSQLALRDSLDVHETLDPLAFPESLHIGALKRPDHAPIITQRVINGKRDYPGMLPEAAAYRGGALKPYSFTAKAMWLK